MDFDAGAKEFAIAFTTAVTETSANPREWIAKNGQDSIFATLQRIYPEVSNYLSFAKAFRTTIRTAKTLRDRLFSLDSIAKTMVWSKSG